MIQQLNIKNFETYFILGNNEDEKLEKRKVIINISIRFPENRACENDQLSDTVCYSGLLSELMKNLENAKFNLVEKAARFVYSVVSDYVNECVRPFGNVKVLKQVELIKPYPPVENLESASFVCSDW